MIYWIYIAIAAFVFAMLFLELWKEKDWRAQVASATILIVLILRILRIK